MLDPEVVNLNDLYWIVAATPLSSIYGEESEVVQVLLFVPILVFILLLIISILYYCLQSKRIDSLFNSEAVGLVQPQHSQEDIRQNILSVNISIVLFITVITLIFSSVLWSVEGYSYEKVNYILIDEEVN